jgi:predicted small lipoprotein YifL
MMQLKKFLVSALAIATVVAVVGCGNDGVPKDNSKVVEPPAPPPPSGPTTK